MNDKVLVLVAVRMKSSRLPKKALADLCGKPLIIRLVERIQQAQIPSKVIICTSTNKQDDKLEKISYENDLECYRGSELDVMSRFIEVADREKANVIVRVTGDNPLTDPLMLDFMIEQHIKKKAEYTFNDDLPNGTRPEIINVEMLKRCHKNLQDPSSSEYMTWMLNRPDYFKTLRVKSNSKDIQRPEISLTVDTPNDFHLINSIYSEFNGNPPKLIEIIKWLDLNPQLIDYQKSSISVVNKEDINYKFKNE